jgi:hypothetical protein
LLINRRNNTFDAIPAVQSGITDRSWAMSAAMGDVNGDGWLDIFVTNYVDQISSYVDTVTGQTIFTHLGFKNRLYINQADPDSVSFIDATDAYGLTRLSTSLSAAFTDYNDDSKIDLYVVNDFGQFIIPNELYRNDAELGILEDVGSASGADIGLFGMGIAIGDYDNDLDLDYYVTNIGRNSLLQNNGDGTFNDVSNLAGVQDSSITDRDTKVGWGTGFMDYDNDGDLDLFISNGYIPAAHEIYNPLHNPNALYRNDGQGTFTQVSDEMHVALTAVCRGGAAGDLDGDGDLDLVFVPVNTSGGFGDTTLRRKVAVYENQETSENHWIAFRLTGILSNRNGYGAHIYLYDNTGGVQLREVDGGSSHASSSSPFVHFGLGSLDAVDSAVVHWPSGIVQTLVDPMVDHLHTIVEESNTVTAINYLQGLPVFEVFPNPMARLLNVSLNGSERLLADLSWELWSLDGRLAGRGNIRSTSFTLDLHAIPSGIYWLQVLTGNAVVGLQQIVKISE